MRPTRVRAFAPASVANVACGFDVLGLALESPGDEVTVERADEPGIVLASIAGDGGRLPKAPDQNTATVAAQALLAKCGAGGAVGLRMTLSKGLPLESGMGSSAASAVAAVVAVNELLALEADFDTLLACALEGERVAAGSAHADNAAASLAGGFVLVRKRENVHDVVRLPIPEGLAVALVHPAIEVSTRDSRTLLGETLRLRDAVQQWANLGALVAGLYREDWDLIATSLVDRVAEPLRAGLVPGFHRAKAAALEAGALGGSLSGSGPSMFVLARDRDTAQRAAGRMAEALHEANGLAATCYVSPVDTPGARVERDPCAS